MAGAHVRTHVAMLGFGIRRRDRREIVGQLVRLVVAGPGFLTDKYPVGNSGGVRAARCCPWPFRMTCVQYSVTRR